MAAPKVPWRHKQINHAGGKPAQLPQRQEDINMHWQISNGNAPHRLRHRQLVDTPQATEVVLVPEDKQLPRCAYEGGDVRYPRCLQINPGLADAREVEETIYPST
eukprot:CAMPEP_0198522576 /NCGR_PEP_ID=MMETSP1462-20131121/21615_1 /TAXON_ID=1333877 /ORGANISM="Brandtodinium nutriculum, Strain RCC3387" /LENGTH=104 /DNA_ID=CAMNT_0044252241 /DNA_START=596 /DNA_END=910 /DNA_ORIENTATION=-